MEFEGLDVIEIEYEVVVGEDEESVTFRINGKVVPIPRSLLVDHDLEGRLWIERSDAAAVGLV
jgi:hypothetical protein